MGAMSVFAACSHGAVYHVNPEAGTRGDGSKERPFRTIAQATARLGPGDRCILHGGVYRETVVPACSGTAELPVTFRGADGETAIVSGCDPVSGWTNNATGIHTANVRLGLGHENQVFLDRRMLWEARWPNAGEAAPKGLLEFKKATMATGTTRTRIVDSHLPDIDWTGASVWVSSHKRWYSWTGRVIGHGKGYLDIQDSSDAKGNHVCKPEGVYYVSRARALLDEVGEWYYDGKTRQLTVRLTPGLSPDNRIEVKRRTLAFDLRGRSHINIRGIRVHAATVLTDDVSTGITIDRCRMHYVYHSNRARNQYGSQSSTGVILRGSGNRLTNSEVAYSSGNALLLEGWNHTVINNHLHDANAIGAYCAPLSFGEGGGHVISHNTIERAGRSCVSTAGLYDTLFQHNDVGWAGYLTYDLGLTYGNGVEGGNSEIRYNRFHDNVCNHICFGVYFDHGCKNLLIHHNVVWNVRDAAFYNNQYANYILYYHNTALGSKYSYRSIWAAAQAKDLYGCRLANNVGSGPFSANGKAVVRHNNVWNCKRLTREGLLPPNAPQAGSAVVVEGITRTRPDRASDPGAYEFGVVDWTAGHDFDHPPADVDTTRTMPACRNRLTNTAFIEGSLDGWEVSGDSVRVVERRYGQWTIDGEAMMGGYSLLMPAGPAELRQHVHGLKPGSDLELMAMVRAPEGVDVALGVRFEDGTERLSAPAACLAPRWARQILAFTVPPEQSSAVVFVRRTDTTASPAHIDDLGFQQR